jgi:hypothetical protein
MRWKDVHQLDAAQLFDRALQICNDGVLRRRSP